jgi:hypothetical protein
MYLFVPVAELSVYLPDPLSEAWRKEAACLDIWATDPDLFFPPIGAPITPRIEALCLGCPVNNECLEYAISENIKIGWWGGVPPRGRRKIRRYIRQGLSFLEAVKEVRRERLEEMRRPRSLEMVS